LLAILFGVAYGSWYGWHGNRLLVAGEDKAFCSSLVQFDERGLGARVGERDLPRFCLRLDDFRATYLDNGQPTAYEADMYVRVPGRAYAQLVRVNEPLRLDRANVYLLGHGYAPVIRYTDRYGQSQTTVAPFLPSDGMLTSDGAALFPDVNVNPATGKRDERAQVGFAGVYLPTVPDDVIVGQSAFPAERDPRLMLQPYIGDLGLDAGVPRSVYRVDQRQITLGRLVKAGDALMLRPGERATLPDGSTVEFLGTREWVTLSARYNPGEPIVLGGAFALLLGLIASLMGKRRRVWFRVTGSDVGDSTVEAGGLPRSDYPGFAEEFDDIVKAVGAAPAPMEAAMVGGEER
jgi:cytochrome c biogenesis protein